MKLQNNAFHSNSCHEINCFKISKRSIATFGLASSWMNLWAYIPTCLWYCKWIKCVKYIEWMCYNVISNCIIVEYLLRCIWIFCETLRIRINRGGFADSRLWNLPFKIIVTNCYSSLFIMTPDSLKDRKLALYVQSLRVRFHLLKLTATEKAERHTHTHTLIAHDITHHSV